MHACIYTFTEKSHNEISCFDLLNGDIFYKIFHLFEFELKDKFHQTE